MHARRDGPRAVRQQARYSDASYERAVTHPRLGDAPTTNALNEHRDRGDRQLLGSWHRHPAAPAREALVSTAATGVEAFVGPFLHFARWGPGEALGCLEQPHRAGGGRDLYAHLFGLLEPRGAVVEFGCGTGSRCRAMASCCPSSTTDVRSITGVDMSVDVVARATADTSILCERRDPRVRFVPGRPDRLPFEDMSVDRIWSVEALHGHTPFAAMAFVAEAARCLVPGGRLVLCAFLGRHALTAHQRAEMASPLGADAVGIEQIGDLDQVCRIVRASGLDIVHDTLRPVGDQVWQVFCAWCMLAHPSSAWPAAWNRAYAPGWIDYFIIAADKPR
ncbi:Methyltransferase 25 [Pandoravirus macleodensis]|uniref:Methyltransferase 25 n=1 Tax=Pandoravirus macleodensis TaxID=2107707 RepID=A0A2U7UG04_9VIRU|nr:Methyltransferase 25 [Pandoravirus macleodensis]AVK77362.1 Methyltransferase 25 [Pandoravirus macleodensis]